MKVIITVTESALPIARTIQREWLDAEVVRMSDKTFLTEHWKELECVVFVGAMGICVRTIAPLLNDKYTDPAVVCVDSTGKYVIPVVSGHIGGANDYSKRIAAILGGEAIITTQSDNLGLWAIDTLAQKYGWQTEVDHTRMNLFIYQFVEKKPTALLLEIRDEGTDYLERTKPNHVKVFYHLEDIPQDEFELIISVTYRNYPLDAFQKPHLCFYAPVLHLGFGCRKQCKPDGIVNYIHQVMLDNGVHPLSLSSISSIELKKDEPLWESFMNKGNNYEKHIYPVDDLTDIEVPNPSEKALEVTGIYGVAEACALKSSQEGMMLIEKHKGQLTEGNHFTFAVCLDRKSCREGHIEIVGAGPGDPELVSVRGKHFLQQADLILYAGSLVPVELTHYAKSGAVVRSSASMTLEEQFALMKEFYDRGLLVVRLHTGDPCIYGAIQEQMAFFDQYRMSYHITPGISSFQAAAAALRSQFTIPEKVQTIILTRGEGRTPMPEKEQLHKLAQSQSTMCIYLSAGIVEQVQDELLQVYPPETPVAACYKLTWKEERIYRGQLKDLARIVRENNLTLTTLLVVGEAIDNRKGLSRLYSHQFKHLFRS